MDGALFRKRVSIISYHVVGSCLGYIYEEMHTFDSFELKTRTYVAIYQAHIELRSGL